MPDAIVCLNQTLYNQYQCNVTAWSNVSEDETWLQDFADAIRDSANDTWDNYMVTNWFLENITVSFLDSTSILYSVVVDFTEGNLQGNVITDGIAPQTPLLVSTSRVGPRPNRGRIYFSGFGEASQTDGIFQTQTAFDFAEMVREWATGFNIGGAVTSLGILRRPSNKFPEYVLNPVDFVSAQVASKSQRRRQRADQ